MAAIDKVYVDSADKFIKFKEWCDAQPTIHDKYGKEVKVSDYLISHWDINTWEDGDVHPIFNAPYYIDAYVIRNCPFDFIQDEMKTNYGKMSQKYVNEAYDIVMKRGGQKAEMGNPYCYLDKDSFIKDENEELKLKDDDSSYDQILRGELYKSASRKSYEYGKHVKCIYHPSIKYNKSYNSSTWWVEVDAGDDDIMWYHDETNTWDFTDELVLANWSSSICNRYKTIKALKKAIIKWKLPVGTLVKCHNRYGDNYLFDVKK